MMMIMRGEQLLLSCLLFILLWILSIDSFSFSSMTTSYGYRISHPRSFLNAANSVIRFPSSSFLSKSSSSSSSSTSSSSSSSKLFVLQYPGQTSNSDSVPYEPSLTSTTEENTNSSIPSLPNDTLLETEALLPLFSKEDYFKKLQKDFQEAEEEKRKEIESMKTMNNNIPNNKKTKQKKNNKKDKTSITSLLQQLQMLAGYYYNINDEKDSEILNLLFSYLEKQEKKWTFDHFNQYILSLASLGFHEKLKKNETLEIFYESFINRKLEEFNWQYRGKGLGELKFEEGNYLELDNLDDKNDEKLLPSLKSPSLNFIGFFIAFSRLGWFWKDLNHENQNFLFSLLNEINYENLFEIRSQTIIPNKKDIVIKSLKGISNLFYSLGKLEIKWNTIPKDLERKFISIIETHFHKFPPESAALLVNGLGRLKFPLANFSNKTLEYLNSCFLASLPDLTPFQYLCLLQGLNNLDYQLSRDLSHGLIDSFVTMTQCHEIHQLQLTQLTEVLVSTLGKQKIISWMDLSENSKRDLLHLISPLFKEYNPRELASLIQSFGRFSLGKQDLDHISQGNLFESISSLSQYELPPWITARIFNGLSLLGYSWNDFPSELTHSLKNFLSDQENEFTAEEMLIYLRSLSLLIFDLDRTKINLSDLTGLLETAFRFVKILKDNERAYKSSSVALFLEVSREFSDLVLGGKVYDENYPILEQKVKIPPIQESVGKILANYYKKADCIVEFDYQGLKYQQSSTHFAVKRSGDLVALIDLQLERKPAKPFLWRLQLMKRVLYSRNYPEVPFFTLFVTDSLEENLQIQIQKKLTDLPKF